MLSFRERLQLSRTEQALAEYELDVALAQAASDRQLRIENGWRRLARDVYSADVSELEWR